MARQGEKKNKSKREYLNKINLYAICSVSIIYSIFKAYKYFFSEDGITKSDFISFLFFTIVNALLYRVLDTLHDYPTAFLYLPLYDFLIITLITQILVNFHWKFWFIYLVIPGYALYKGGIYIYEYVKTLSQPLKEGEQAYIPQNERKLRGF